MIAIIHYFNPLYVEDFVLSIDNIVLDFYMVRPAVREQLPIIIDKLTLQHGAEAVRWASFKPGTFQENTSIRLDGGNAFWVGVGLNSKNTVWERCRVEFNPNKVGNSLVCIKVLHYLCNRTSPSQRKVARFDLAIDIPVPRDSCFLVKDRRLYIERRHGQEYTQYLGAKSSAVGRVKLYNKQVESQLAYPLTRLELTLDPATPYEKINFPTVFYLDTPNLSLDHVRVTDTERFILNALLQGYGSLNDLGRKTRAKIEKLMTEYVHRVEITQTDYTAILNQLQAYLS